MGQGAIRALLEKGEGDDAPYSSHRAIALMPSPLTAYRVVAVFRDAASADKAKTRLGNPSESTFTPVIGTLGRVRCTSLGRRPSS